jgi:hypothetical protein
MHCDVESREPGPPAGELTLFEWAGGAPALTRMTRLFYEKYVPEDALLAPLFANIAADHPERVVREGFGDDGSSREIAAPSQGRLRGGATAF